ncbi:MAG TPA: hypothetical protein VFI22_07220 [Thermomicrobiales bacterium]|nr:hypothetical protein [Thermomicrobiales bacterium]
MTTRMELRAELRLRLEDGATPPLWDDAALDEAIAEGIRGYGRRVPREATATIAASGGESSLPMPGIGRDRIARVIDPDGRALPPLPASDDGDPAATGQAWRCWNETVLLARPAAAGSWRIDYLAARTLPADDATALDIVPGDEALVASLALAAALRRRATEDAKRGMPPLTAGLAAATQAAAERLFAARGRRARGGWL